MELFPASVAACNKTPAFPLSLIIQWIEIRWIGDHSLLAMKSWRFDLMKFEIRNVKNNGYLIDWVRLNVPPTHYRSYGDGFLRVKWPNQQCQSTMGTPRKINAILLNIKINWPKLVDMCRYKLATYWQNVTEIFVAEWNLLQKVFGGATFFDSHCTRLICRIIVWTWSDLTPIFESMIVLLWLRLLNSQQFQSVYLFFLCSASCIRHWRDFYVSPPAISHQIHSVFSLSLHPCIHAYIIVY